VSGDAKKDAEARRLAWRCRRGLLELDIVLQRFVASQFIHLSHEELSTLDALLDLPDNDFWDLLVNENTSIDELKTKKLIQKIQSIHQER
jgi:antitoxin CptB